MEFCSINWGSVANWVSGLGSLSAVVTALYLASNSRRIKLTGYCGVRLIVGAGGPKQELVFLSVTNVGSRTATINNIGMRVGRFKKRHAIITLIKDFCNDGIPLSLADGQVGKWGIPLDQDKQWIKELAGGFVKTATDARTLRFLVYTTHGAMKVIKPEAHLVEEIQKALGSQHAKPALG